MQPSGPPQGRRLCAILNAGGGTMRRLGAEAVRDQVAQGFAEHGVAAEVLLVDGAEMRGKAEAARAAAEAGELDGVVVGGGDGSVGTVAGVLAGTRVPLGVLPLGTLNHFAKDLGMPQEVGAAVAAIAAAQPRAVDVAEVNGRVFVNNSLIGVYPYMVLDRERRRNLHGLSKWPAMTLAFVRMLWRFPRRRLTLHAAGSATRYRTPCLFVGNNEYRFGLFSLGRPRIDQGRLWLLVAKPRGPGGLLWLACRVMFGGFREADDFEVLQVTEAEIMTEASQVPVAADGEVERMRPPLRYRIRPSALQVLGPAERVTATEP